MDTVHECDRETDGPTDRITIMKTVQRIASHGKNTRFMFACEAGADSRSRERGARRVRLDASRQPRVQSSVLVVVLTVSQVSSIS